MKNTRKIRKSVIGMLVISITVVTMLLAGCGKDDITPNVPGVTTFCWECTLTLTMSGISDSQKFTECGLTVTEIRKVEKDNTWSKTVDGVTMTAKTKCVKK